MHSLKIENILSEIEQEYGLDVKPDFEVNYKVRVIYQNGMFNHPVKALTILFNYRR